MISARARAALAKAIVAYGNARQNVGFAEGADMDEEVISAKKEITRGEFGKLSELLDILTETKNEPR